MLGPVRAAADGGRAVGLGGPKQRLVLALLIVRIGRVVSVDELVDGIWGERASAGSRSTLQTYMSNLRAITNGLVEHEGGGYRLDARSSEVDALFFEEAVVAARSAVDIRPWEAASSLRNALAMWEGRPYADVPATCPIDAEARRLNELRLCAIEDRVEAELLLGRHRDVMPELEVLAGEYPLSERLHGHHMVALYRSGRQSDALRLYDRARALLREELGVDPTPELQELQLRILVHDDSLRLAPSVSDVWSGAVSSIRLDQ